MKKIVIAGGNGYLGKLLTHAFHDRGDQVTLLVRKTPTNIDYAECVIWDGKTQGDWAKVLEGADALINLAGKSVDCRYTEANKKEIYASRLNATNALGLAISKCKVPPKCWLNSSSATIYRDARDREMDEYTGEIGTGFSVDVCQKWEQAFGDHSLPHTRRITMRTSIVLGPHGGALTPLKRLAQFGLGGKQGTGKQYFSWISETDFVRAVMFLADQETTTGAYNLAVPYPVQNATFMAFLRRSIRMPLGLPLPVWLLKIGAMLIATETELILKSRRVVPARLLEAGFAFHQPTLDQLFHK